MSRRSLVFEATRREKAWSFFCYLLFWFGVFPLIAWALHRHDTFIVYHARQAARLFYAWLIANVIIAAAKFGLGLRHLGSSIGAMLGFAFLVAWIAGMVWSLKGEEKAILDAASHSA
ncbi:hypothetical protein HY642_03295 [Candidatus Woesearchaeota archaeon]|nr:hypothetical protein [Candidatus Woesearchaeota archaeon]